jgi:hypothetical protein
MGNSTITLIMDEMSDTQSKLVSKNTPSKKFRMMNKLKKYAITKTAVIRLS